MSEEGDLDDESSLAVGQAIGAALFAPILKDFRNADLAN